MNTGGGREGMRNEGKPNLLASVKENFTISPHLIVCKNPLFMSALTKIRTSSHKFPIETGRYIGINRVDRVCLFGCKVIGDEFHYLTECKNPFMEKGPEANMG